MLGSSLRRLLAAIEHHLDVWAQDIGTASERRRLQLYAEFHLEVLEHELTDICDGIGSWSEVTEIDPRFPRMFKRWRSHIRRVREDLKSS